MFSDVHTADTKRVVVRQISHFCKISRFNFLRIKCKPLISHRNACMILFLTLDIIADTAGTFTPIIIWKLPSLYQIYDIIDILLFTEIDNWSALAFCLFSSNERPIQILDDSKWADQFSPHYLFV